MSNDLISRNELLDSLRGNVLVDVTSELEKVILEQPTAYDLDKVIEQLEEKTRLAYKKYIDCDSRTPALEYLKYGTQFHVWRECLEIVKAGFQQ